MEGIESSPTDSKNYNKDRRTTDNNADDEDNIRTENHIENSHIENSTDMGDECKNQTFRDDLGNKKIMIKKE